MSVFSLADFMATSSGRIGVGWHRHRLRPGDTPGGCFSEEWELLHGHQWEPRPGHTRELSHGHGHAGPVTYWVHRRAESVLVPDSFGFLRVGDAHQRLADPRV